VEGAEALWQDRRVEAIESLVALEAGAALVDADWSRADWRAAALNGPPGFTESSFGGCDLLEALPIEIDR
jgi:hypothetical protein